MVWVGVALVGLLLAFAIFGLTSYWWVRHRSLPDLSGEFTVSGIDKEILIARDRYGIPHISAQSATDAAFAMGYLHGQDRLWQLDLNRRVSSGRVSELAGDEGLACDRFVRRIGLRRVAMEELSQLTVDEVRILESYASGINHYAHTAKHLPLEFQLLKLAFEPWQPADSLCVGKLVALGLSLNWDMELQRLQLLRAVGPEIAAKLQLIYPEENPTIVNYQLQQVGVPVNGELVASYKEISRWIPAMEGASNSWVVDGSLTSTGRPMLCNDPHLVVTVPSTWYQAHIVAGDDFAAAGATMPGFPFVILGHNRKVAWGFTNSFADCQDLVIEDLLNAEGTHYRTEAGFIETQILRETIHVKGGSDVVEEVLVTRHGPIVQRTDKPEIGAWRGLALQWTALTPGVAVRAMLELQRANDWESFRRAMNLFDAPSQNAIYADVEGHIGYICGGRIPVRRRAPSGVPVVGWVGDALWERFLTVDEVPQVFNPPEHFVVTANNRVISPSFPHYISHDYMNGYRARRIQELLQSSVPLSTVTMAGIQMDLKSIPGQEVARLLQQHTCENPETEKLRALLAAWDGTVAAESQAALFYEIFMRHLIHCCLRPLCGESWTVLAGNEASHPVFKYPGNLLGRVTPQLISRWRVGDTSWFDDKNSWNEVVDEALNDAAAEFRKLGRRNRWGHVHQMPLKHAAGVTWLTARIFNLDALSVGGDTDTVMATSYNPTEPYETTLWAPGWRQIIDVGEWDKSSAIHLPGQSGQPGSRHYADLIKRWKKNQLVPMAWSEGALRKQAKRRLTLKPRQLAVETERPPEAA